jgi:hypothetical protein
VKHIFLCLFICLSSTIPAYTPSDIKTFKDPYKLLRHIEQLYREESSYATLSMSVTTPNFTRKVQFEAWSMGEDFTLIKIMYPKKEKGIATLKRKQNMWNYLPKIKRRIKIPVSMMSGSWMGSDFTNDDLVKQSQLEKDYHLSLKEENNFYKITLTPKANAPTVWGKIIIIIKKTNLTPSEYIYYDEKGKKIRTLSFDRIKNFSDRRLPSRLKMVNHLKTNQSTILEYQKLDFSIKLDKDFFNFRNLEAP